jgi:hypothetical protein
MAYIYNFIVGYSFLYLRFFGIGNRCVFLFAKAIHLGEGFGIPSVIDKYK